MMKTYLGWLHLRMARALLALAICAGPGAAFAANYTIFLKKPGSNVPESCANGAITFNKPNVAGETSVVVSMTLTAQNPGQTFECLGTSNSTRLQAGSYAGNLLVVVENVTLAGQDQGLNVVGLRGTLTRSSGQGGQLVFAYTSGSASSATKPASPVRTLTIRPTTDSTADQSTGSYHIFNTNSVPEPGTWLLLLTALGALYLVRRKSRQAA